MKTPPYPVSEADFSCVRDDLQRKLTRQPGWWVDDEPPEKAWLTRARGVYSKRPCAAPINAVVRPITVTPNG